jgi:phage repressor protein C with HTH and peptisase S24 domain
MDGVFANARLPDLGFLAARANPFVTAAADKGIAAPQAAAKARRGGLAGGGLRNDAICGHIFTLCVILPLVNRKINVACGNSMRILWSMSEISQAARRLKMLRERAGLSMRAVSEALGWTLTRYQHYEDRYRRSYLPLDLARQLSDLFAQRGVPPADVLALAGVEPTPRDVAPESPSPFPPSRGPFQPRLPDLPAVSPRDLPVMGTAKGGAEGTYFNEGEPKEYIDRPPSLAGVTNAFALYVDGESMEPRYYAGEVIYVNPNRPLTRGCFVAVEMADRLALIKQFIRRNDEHLVLAQLNPPKEIRLPIAQVKRIYRITGSGEAG